MQPQHLAGAGAAGVVAAHVKELEQHYCAIERGKRGRGCRRANALDRPQTRKFLLPMDVAAGKREPIEALMAPAAAALTESFMDMTCM